MRPGQLTDGHHECIGSRPTATDVNEVSTDGVVGNREPLGEVRINLIIGQCIWAV